MRAQLYTGGTIHTMDEVLPRAEAVAVAQGRIAAVGSPAECRLTLGSDFETVDLAGGTLLPGFIDTHLHPIMLFYFEQNADLSSARSMAEVQQRMRQAAADGKAGDWTVGLQFDDEALDQPRLPTRHDLDATCPDRPVLVVKHDGHTLIANTAAIRAAGLGAGTPDPEGGVIDRETDGHPSGVFREAAAQLVLGAVPAPNLENLRSAARACFGRMASQGITTAGVVLQTDDEGPAGSAGRLETVAMQLLLDEVPFSLYSILIGKDVGAALAARESPLHDPAAGRRVGGVKIYADGTFGSCTAYMSEPFSDQPERRGFLVLEVEEIYRRMVAAHRAGLQVCIHAIGDEANRRCLDLYERLLTEHPRADHRHRLEHASLLDAGIVERIARLGLVVATQPLFIHSEKGWLHKRLGPERARWTYPLRALLDAGVPVAGASDAPVESTDVLHAIQCCVTREGFETHQAIGADEALRLYTTVAAWAQREEDEKGSLAPGKRADLVVLSRDPTTVPADEIAAIQVQRTIAGGIEVYRRS
jgi:predicted amidohydrolase YtcJ